MRRLSLLISVVLTFALVAGTLIAGEGSAPAKASGQKPVMKIGVILPLSGNNASLGENARDGMLLRMSELSKESNFDYKLIFEDDEFVPAKMNLAAQKLKSLDKVDVMVTMWGQASYVILPRLQGTSILHISIDRWTDAKPPYPYDFVVGGTRPVYTKRAIDLLKALGVKKIAMFTNTLAGPMAFDEELLGLIAKTDIQIVEYTKVSLDNRDFRVPILRAREAGAELVLNDLASPQTEILLKQMREIGFHPIIGCPSSYLQNFISDPVLIEGAFEILNPPATEIFAKHFQEKFNKKYVYPATFGYDALSLYIHACEQLPPGTKPTTEAICGELKKIKDFPSGLGTTSFEKPNLLASPVVYYIVQNGQHKVVSLEELVKFYKK